MRPRLDDSLRRAPAARVGAAGRGRVGQRERQDGGEGDGPRPVGGAVREAVGAAADRGPQEPVAEEGVAEEPAGPGAGGARRGGQRPAAQRRAQGQAHREDSDGGRDQARPAVGQAQSGHGGRAQHAGQQGEEDGPGGAGSARPGRRPVLGGAGASPSRGTRAYISSAREKTSR